MWIPAEQLEHLFDKALKGISLAGLPLRTRSKVVKTAVYKALGYPVPSSFKKTRPRFPGQCFDTYVQKADNLQVWNEESSSPFHGPRRWISSVLNNPITVSASALSYESPVLPTDRRLDARLGQPLRVPNRQVLHAPIAVMHQRLRGDDGAIVERLLQRTRARSLRSEVDARQPTIRRENTSMTCQERQVRSAVTS